MSRTWIVCLSHFLIAAGAARSEELFVQIKTLQAQVEALSRQAAAHNQAFIEQRRLIEEQSAELRKLREEAPAAKVVIDEVLEKYGALEDTVETRTAQAIKIASRNKPLSGNLSIGAAVDTSFGFTTGDPRNYDRPTNADFRLRGAELVFAADVDPYFKSYIVLNAAADGTAGDEAVMKVEEAAIYSTSLQYAQVRGGRFFVPFGRLSMIHDHDLPFVTRPRSIDAYVGGESGGDGIQVQALMPIQHFLQVTGGIFDKVGANFPLYSPTGQSRDGRELTFCTKVLTTFDICADHTVELGVSAIEVPDAPIHRDLTDLELTYKWHPKNGNALREKLVFGTELMRNDQGTPFEVTLPNPPPPHPFFTDQRRTGFGGYGYGEYFMTRHWSAGGRIDFFQNVDPTLRSSRTDQTYTAFATFKFSEFSRLRVEVSRHEFFNGTQGNELLVQWTAFWGAHSHDFNGR